MRFGEFVERVRSVGRLVDSGRNFTSEFSSWLCYEIWWVRDCSVVLNFDRAGVPMRAVVFCPECPPVVRLRPDFSYKNLKYCRSKKD